MEVDFDWEEKFGLLDEILRFWKDLEKFRKEFWWKWWLWERLLREVLEMDWRDIVEEVVILFCMLREDLEFGLIDYESRDWEDFVYIMSVCSLWMWGWCNLYVCIFRKWLVFKWKMVLVKFWFGFLWMVLKCKFEKLIENELLCRE